MAELRKFGDAQRLSRETQGRIEDLFTRQLRKLGDVQVVPLLLVDSKEAHDVKLRVLVSVTLEPQQNSQQLFKTQSYAVAVTATRPETIEQVEAFARSWLAVAGEKDLESTVADLINKFDHEVLEADRKRIRFRDAVKTDQFPEPPPVAPTVTVPPALFNEVKPRAPADSAAGPAQAPGGEVFRVGGGVTAPALLHKVEPEYSKEALKAKYQGTVILYVEISPDGHAVNPRVVRSLGLGLDEKAIEAVRKWKFRPGYKDGKAVTVAATIEINFRL